ncbi:MAG: hypothetical protein WDW36_007055 [Sanguina aurantia]
MSTGGATHRLTLLLNHEIASVITTMRFNSKWAGGTRYDEEDRNETNKYDEAFRSLRSEIFKHNDWSQVDPMLYLDPFLSLITAKDVSGPITGAAAVALQRILGSGIISPTTLLAGAAVNRLVEDAAQCKFESTNDTSDEVVLLNIVQVLVLAVEGPTGVLLTDESICKAVQAAFMLGDPVTKPKEYGEIMSYYSRQTCGRMIDAVFSHFAADLLLVQAEEDRLALAAAHHAQNGGEGGMMNGHSAAVSGAGSQVTCCYSARAAVSIMEFLVELIQKALQTSSATKEQAEDTVIFALDMIHMVLGTVGGAVLLCEPLTRLIQVELTYEMCRVVVMYHSASVINGFCQVLLAIYKFMGSISMGQIELVLERVLLKLADGKGVTSVEQQEAALEGLLDLCRQPGFVHDVFANCDCRVERANLFEDICALVSRTALPVAKGAISPQHLISLEALLSVLDALGAGPKPPSELLPHPSPSNHSRTPQISLLSFPLFRGPKPPFQLPLSPAQAPFELLPPPSPSLDLAGYCDVWGPLTQGHHPDLRPLMESAAMGVTSAAEHMAEEVGPTRHQGMVLVEWHGMQGMSVFFGGLRVTSVCRAVSAAQCESNGSSAEYQTLKAAVCERHLKQKVALAVDLFNKDGKKGLIALQAAKLLPKAPVTGDEAADMASSNLLATKLGQFLRVCPGLSKMSIGELLGEPDPFYLKVLEAYTLSFDFGSEKFDSAIRMYLESFRLPGEAQKIDRIINSFGRRYYQLNEAVFRHADAAYVLAYSVIMLNTDQHNTQVKQKMTLDSFRRNLRGVNDGKDFEPAFLQELYEGIVRTPLRLSEVGSMDVSEQAFSLLQQASGTPRGTMTPSHSGRHLFDTTMFRLMWGPAVHALCAIIDNVTNQSLVDDALGGLMLASKIAADHGLEDVADSIIVNLSKIPQQIVNVGRPEAAFGRDAKMRAVTAAIATVVNKHGDCLRSGWTNFMDLMVGFYRQSLLPDTFCRALAGDGDGGLVVREGECSSLKGRRAAASASAAAGNSGIFRTIASFTQVGAEASECAHDDARVSLRSPGGHILGYTSTSSAYHLDFATDAQPSTRTTMMVMPSEPEYPDRQGSESDRQFAALSEDVMVSCGFEDVFMDSKFLKQESLQHLVKAILSSGGSIPRSTVGGAANNGPAAWDVAELCLELCFTVLLRNRYRIASLWPRIYEHFQNIFSHSKDVDIVLVQKAIMAMLRLCQRLLPYKTDSSEPLMRGIQLVALVDDQVASELAPTIASEILALLQGAAPFIHNQQAWVSICSLLKIIQYDAPSYPVVLDTLTWVIKESLTMLNYTIVLQTVVDLLERSIPSDPTKRGGQERPGHPQHIPDILELILAMESWLELWWEESCAKNSPEAAERLGLVSFKLDSWLMLVGMLCKLTGNNNLEVRSTSVSYLQRAVVAAEALAIDAACLEKSLEIMILPLMKDLSKALGGREMPQADATVRELVRCVSKMVLLHHPLLEGLPKFGKIWRDILDALLQTLAGNRSEALAEAVPEALKNMLLVLQSQGKLKEGWRDGDTDMWELTWRISKKISPGLTAALLCS